MSVYRDKKEWNKWNEMVTASEHATEDFNDFADDAAIIRADKKIQSLRSKNLSLKSELEALKATEECTSQEIEIKALKGFLNDIANHDWDLSEMGAEEIYRGACELEKKLYHIPAVRKKVTANKGRL